MIKTIFSSLLVTIMIVFFPVQNRRITNIAFGTYVLGVLFITLLTRDDPGFGQMHLIPLKQVVIWMKRYYQAYGVRRMFDPLFGLYLNVLLFVPFGFLLHLPPRRAIIIGFLFSFAIEIIQLVTRLGMFETDDLMTNTLGTWIGTVAYRERTIRNAPLR